MYRTGPGIYTGQPAIKVGITGMKIVTSQSLDHLIFASVDAFLSR